MNYGESKLILGKIKKAKRILLNCHQSPDLDSIGSALALNYVLETFGKKVSIICPSKKLFDQVSFLKDYKKIKRGVDFGEFKFKNYDLFITLDSSSWDMVSSDKKIIFPDIKIIVIDHHHTNTNYGDINLVDKKASSVAEMLYRIFEDWAVYIDKSTATALLTGIIGDTGIFKYPNASLDVFRIAYELMKRGAQKDTIIANIYQNYDYNLIKFNAEALSRIHFDKKNKFLYSALPYQVYERLGKPQNAKHTAVDLFAEITKGADFGFMALEEEKGKLSVSFRAREDFDTSKIALALGGGGHQAASGAKVEGLPFGKAVQKVLEVARKYAKEFQKSKKEFQKD